MRVTNKTLVNTFLNNLSNNLESMKKYQEQLSSSQKYSRPSDNPYQVARSIELNSTLNRNKQYKSNIEDASGWLEITDSALGQIGDSLNKIRTLIIDASSGTKSQTEYDSIKEQITQLVGEISESGNLSYGGKYIFSGDATTTMPFKVSADGSLTIIAGIDQNQLIKREISPGVDMEINIPAIRIMKGTSVDGTPLDLANTIKGIMDDLGTSGDITDLSSTKIQEISDNIDNILRLRAEVGSKENRMDAAKSRTEEEDTNLTAILSKIADVDVAETAIEYNEMQTVYQASLMTGAKILQPSLLDFLS